MFESVVCEMSAIFSRPQCVNHLLVQLITHDPIKWESPNLDQRCKRHWLRSLLFCGIITLTFKVKFNLKPKFTPFRACPHHKSSPIQARIAKFGPEVQSAKYLGLDPYCFMGWMTLTFKVKFNLKKSKCPFSPLLEIYNHHIITTREPWVSRLLHRPDCFMVSILCTYLYT